MKEGEIEIEFGATMAGNVGLAALCRRSTVQHESIDGARSVPCPNAAILLVHHAIIDRSQQT